MTYSSQIKKLVLAGPILDEVIRLGTADFMFHRLPLEGLPLQPDLSLFSAKPCTTKTIAMKIPSTLGIIR